MERHIKSWLKFCLDNGEILSPKMVSEIALRSGFAHGILFAPEAMG